MSIESLDFSKKLNEWAVTVGRNLQSPQTGYVHYYHDAIAQETGLPQTIPLFQNVLFALALLQSRLVEQVQEAKVLIKGLLAFQNLYKEEEAYGNFPVYLHEYPTCRDNVTGLQLLAPFFWILSQFGHILGASLKDQLECAVHLALENAKKSNQIQPFPYVLSVKLAAAQMAYGSLWELSVLRDAGKRQLEKLAVRQLEGWSTTRHLGDLLIGLQMVFPSLNNSPWSQLWKRMEATWHYLTGSFVGPLRGEWQEGEEPQINLYDLFGGYFARQFSKRATLSHHIHLYGVLIRPTTDKFQTDLYPLKIDQKYWKIENTKNWAYTSLQIDKPDSAAASPFRLIWGDLHLTHSLVCQGGRYDKVNVFDEEQCYSLIFDLKEDIPVEERSRREIEFFLNFQPDLSFLQKDGEKTTTFELGQQIKIFSNSSQGLFSIRFDLIQGEGDFMGHVSMANRPFQSASKKGNYDWAIFLRTLRRNSSCRLKVSIEHSFI